MRIVAVDDEFMALDNLRLALEDMNRDDEMSFFQRADERYKAAIHIEYMQDTWPLNFDGEIETESAMTIDISAGGCAMYLGRHFDVGEIIQLDLPRVGTTAEGRALHRVTSVVCWQREAPRGSIYRMICGIQFRFGDPSEKEKVVAYIKNLKTIYKL